MSLTVQTMRLAQRAARKAPAKASIRMSKVDEKEDVVNLLDFWTETWEL
jgi:hypothetical protein